MDAQLTEAERRDGYTGKEICHRLEAQATAMREAAARKVAHDQLEAEKGRLEEQATGEGQKEMEAHAEEKEAHAEEKEAYAEGKVTHDEGKEAGAREDEAAEEEEADAQEESPIKRSARVYGGKKTSPQVTSNEDVEIVEVAGPVVHNVCSCPSRSHFQPLM